MGGKVAINSPPFITCNTGKRLLTKVILLTIPAVKAVIRVYMC